MTVFALDDQAVFARGADGYVTSVRFHIIPGRRLTRAILQQLRPGTKLPTLAGEDENLVITPRAGSGSDEVRINYIPVKQLNMIVNSRVAVHSIYVPFPRLRFASSRTSTLKMDASGRAVMRTLPKASSGIVAEKQGATEIKTELEETRLKLKARVPGFCKCVASHLCSTGSMYWSIAQFLLNCCFTGCVIMLSAIGHIARFLGVHPLGLPVVFAVLKVLLFQKSDLINIPIKEREFQNLDCECGKPGLFRMSYQAKWFCASCLESHLWTFSHAGTSRKPMYPLQRFKIHVFGSPDKSLKLDRFPELCHVEAFPSWYPTEVTENWFAGELKIQYTSFCDILDRVEPRKFIAVYSSYPPHRLLRRYPRL